MKKAKRTRAWQKLLILVFVTFMVARPLMVFATSDVHIEYAWSENIEGTTIELSRYHHHFDYRVPGTETIQLLCGIASEVSLSETQVEAAINDGSLEALVRSLSDLEFLDFHTDIPIDGSSAWVDVSQVTNSENLNGYECMIYLDNTPVFTTKVYVVGEVFDPPEIPIPIDEPEDVEEVFDPPVTPTVTPTPTPTVTPTPSVTPTDTPTSIPTKAPIEESVDPPDVSPPKKPMSAAEVAGLGAETVATVAVGISVLGDLKIIRFCKRGGFGKL